ncbi:MAG TPA: pyridoxal phosphate-dependent aminotransferase [Holophagaceae bacterium]|nr:pyridoxal phosphate-dependent aminotransferase [Holophagaceae bacterium]
MRPAPHLNAMQPAARVASLRPSPIRQLSEGAPADAIPLGLGEPTWALPEPGRRALAAFSGTCTYGPTAGLPELRRAVAAYHRADVEEVLITSGSEEALFALLQAWVEPGAKVLMSDPGFVAYESLTTLAGGEVRTYPLDAGRRFRLDADALIARLDEPGLRVVILNHPCNPTGGGATLEALRRVAEACEARGLLLISDEVYRDLHFGAPQPSLRDVSAAGVITSSVSKGWGAPGLRVGWMVGDPKWLAPARTVHAFAVTTAAHPAQVAARALIEASGEVLPAARREVALRFEALAEAMKEHFHQEIAPPDGAFYHWLPLPASAHADPMAFALRLRDEARVVLVPGIIFGEGGRGHARLSFAASPEQIREGVRRLAPFWRMP